MAIERVASVVIAAPVEAVFAHLDDLARYPFWTDMVSRAVPAPTGPDARPAWVVDLRGQVGPLARSKRLRMVRERHDPPTDVVFERREDDARSHASWTLAARVASMDVGARVTMTFRYGGALWGPVVDRLLGDEIERSKYRLAALVERGSRGPDPR